MSIVEEVDSLQECSDKNKILSNAGGSDLIDYLSSDKGHEIASRLISVIESVKHSTIDSSATNVRIEKIVQAFVIVMVVGATSVLVALGKFEASVGVLFGTLVGYAFGKKI